MVAVENSGISDKEKLRELLYRNPDKLAIKLLQFLADENGEPLLLARIKGTGEGGYFYSIQEKKLIYAPRNAEYYLLNWMDPENPDKCYIYGHHVWSRGVILRLFKDEIEILGYN